MAGSTVWPMAGKLSSVLTYGSGRPIDATVAGDANQDGNTYNDRLPGYRRNAFIGPDYSTTDFRVTRTCTSASAVDSIPGRDIQYLQSHQRSSHHQR